MDVEGRLRTIMDVFRRECHRVLQSERVTVHGADSMLMVLQLAMAEVNKQGNGEFEVSLSDVLVVWRYLLLDKLHLLPFDNLTRPENYDLILKTYESFLKRSNTVDLVDVHSLSDQLRVEPGTSDALNPVELFEFLSGKGDDLPLAEPSTPSSQRGPSRSKMQAEVRRVFLSYLSLLVNSKDDLALAHVLDIPGRALGRAAFTDLKHAARRANTSMFLAVTSFVRAIQLGGKGYAPAEADPLRKHVKGLSDFVQFLDSLEEVLGEVPDPGVCGGRLVAAIRAALVKGRGGGEDRAYGAIDQTARALKESIGQLHRGQQGGNAVGTGISPARPRAHKINHATALGGRLTVKTLTLLLDQEALAPPCRNKAELLCEGPPSTLGGDEGGAMLTLFRSPAVPSGDSPQPLKSRVQSRQDLLKPKVRPPGALSSQFACTYREEAEPPLSRVLEFPSGSQIPSCIHPAPRRPPAAPRRPLASGEEEEEEEEEETGRRAGVSAGRASGPVRGQEPGVPRPGNAGLRPSRAPNGRSRSVNGSASPKKGSKRKQVDAENLPQAKRPAPPLVKSGPKKKKQLITGQGTLTGFFRL
ncbi:PCNA-interacting partner [Gadus macrocephalus]|uniref:PCNA-interacting partner n=1 Tax=Gadus macrocephalus TaxID=80720 RepID=UPI0028CB1997|nr:PCNA-interacting partner [Gadus macrocephalus]